MCQLDLLILCRRFFRASFILSVFVLSQIDTVEAKPDSTETSEVTRIASPSGQVEVVIALQAGQPRYSVFLSGQPLLTPSRLGLQVEGSTAAYTAIATQSTEVDDHWQPVWGKRREVRNHYRTATVTFQSSETTQLTIHFRVYDDAVALRYELPAGDEQTAKISADSTTFAFADDAVCWSYNYENANIGPEKLCSIDGPRLTPMVLKLRDDCYVALHEAALYDAAWMSLESAAGETSLSAKILPYEAAGGFQTPWRVLMIGATPGELVDSDLLMNLNPPCELADTDWIKPGVCFWDWRAWGHKADGFTYDLNLDSWKRFVDFAQETSVPYLLLDANWYGPEFEEDSNPTETGKVEDVKTILTYAKQRNVGILLYLNDVAGQKYDLDTVLKNYSDWGAVGIKYGFMKGEGQDKVQRTRKIIQLCAKHHLVVDFHDLPVPPTGDIRTWPNCLTVEFCHAQSDAKRAFTPKTFVTAAFVNGLAGPLDMANGMFDLENSVAQRPRIFEEVHSTLVAEAARSLIVFTGLNVLPDSPDSYREHLELFGFIAAQKMPWEQSKTLQGEIGEYLTVMRQTGSTFLVASATSEEPRTLSIPLDFLGAGEYEATLYEDAADAHYQTNREAYVIRRETVTAATTVEARLAPGGGHCIKLVPLATVPK